jgi:hypothetical protein
MEAHSGAKIAPSGAMEASYGAWRLALEPWRLILELWRLTLEPGGSLWTMEAHFGAIEAHSEARRITLDP